VHCTDGFTCAAEESDHLPFWEVIAVHQVVINSILKVTTLFTYVLVKYQVEKLRCMHMPYKVVGINIQFYPLRLCPGQRQNPKDI
jgi:hypothetical protein